MSRFRELQEKVVTKLLNGVDRLYHTRARRLARERVAGEPRPRRVSVVCYGNICRSPYAARYLEKGLAQHGLAMIVSSAGFYGPGRPANDRGASVARGRGISLDGHCSQMLNLAEVTQTDLALVMTRHQRRALARQFRTEPPRRIELLGDFDPTDPVYREIDDPYGKSDEEFRRVFDQIERCMDGLMAIWADPNSRIEPGALRA